MSNKERAINLINTFDESQLDNIIALLESVRALANEAEDDAFCLFLVEQAKKENDGTTISADQLMKECGISHDDLQN